MRPLLFVAFLIAISLFGCKKQPTKPTLPAATHSGANTFGCLIDGEVFTVSGKSYLGSPNGLTLQASSSYVWLVEGKLGNKTITLQFDYNGNPHVPGTFIMANNYPSQGNYFYTQDGTLPTSGTQYSTNSAQTGSITLTDYTSTYASGTFAFDAMNGDGKVVHVTDGRFDISF